MSERRVTVRRGRHYGWWVDGRSARGKRFMLTWWAHGADRPSGGAMDRRRRDSRVMSGDSSGATVRWVGLAIDCAEAPPMARFYENLLGFTVGELGPYWAQLWDPAGGVHLNIQGDKGYVPPTWPEKPEQQAKMMHFEVEVDDLEVAVALAIEAGGTEAPWQPPDRNRERLRVMLDPAGHPLCLFLRGE